MKKVFLMMIFVFLVSCGGEGGLSSSGSSTPTDTK
jgi:hypothetical protein